MKERDRARTLIELMIVVAIVVLLCALMMSIGSYVQLRAKLALTDRRIETIRAAFADLGRDGSGGTYAIQKYLQDPVTPSPQYGVVRFTTNSPIPQPDPVGGGTWADLAPKYNLGTPWGRPNLIGSAETDPDIALAEFNPLQTIKLMSLIGILPPDDPETLAVDEALTAYASRNPNAAWNDYWGNPLVIGYALFQPSDSDPIAAGRQVLAADRQYQYSRKFYYAIADAGPKLTFALDFSTPAATDATLSALWLQANAVCQANPADTWTGSRFATPPWQGVRHAKDEHGSIVLRSSLSAPLDLP